MPQRRHSQRWLCASRAAPSSTPCQLRATSPPAISRNGSRAESSRYSRTAVSCLVPRPVTSPRSCLATSLSRRSSSCGYSSLQRLQATRRRRASAAASRRSTASPTCSASPSTSPRPTTSTLTWPPTTHTSPSSASASAWLTRSPALPRSRPLSWPPPRSGRHWSWSARHSGGKTWRRRRQLPLRHRRQLPPRHRRRRGQERRRRSQSRPRWSREENVKNAEL
mmetsp:Transcript_15405/g.60208  ORF Transcript_15405/g.60208 Transcript_15405/m.60208 type:complete len:223 (-) Transcript_15405:9-677(-)